MLVRELPVPYSDVNCHCALYQLLLTLCLEPHPLVSPPLTAALSTFTTDLHHPANQVHTEYNKKRWVVTNFFLELILVPTKLVPGSLHCNFF